MADDDGLQPVRFQRAVVLFPLETTLVGASYGQAFTGDLLGMPLRPKPVPSSARNRRSRQPSDDRPETRRAIRSGWLAAKGAAEKLLLAVRLDDPEGRVIAADDLDACLSRLWDLRGPREVNWRAILNHCQGLMKQLFSQKRVERLTEAECGALLEIVERHLGPATKSADDLNEAVRLISDAGFDPFAAISGDPESPEAG